MESEYGDKNRDKNSAVIALFTGKNDLFRNKTAFFAFRIEKKMSILKENSFMIPKNAGQISSLPSCDLYDEGCFYNSFNIANDYDEVLGLGSIPQEIDAAGLCICFEGSAEIVINTQRYCLQKGDMCVIIPNTILKVSCKSDDFKGYTIAITRNFFHSINIPSSTSIYLYVKENPCISLSQAQQDTLLRYCNSLKEHAAHENHPFRNEISGLMVMAAIYEIIAIYKNKQPLKHQPYSRKNKLFLEFQQLITTHYSKHKTIDFYADKLCVSSRYLSAVSKEISGLTASDCITRVTIMNAKSLLANTEMTIQQISESLNFPNPSFFTKYFKRIVGETPKTFREKEIYKI